MEGSKGMKWKEKADVLIKLGKAVKANPKVGRSWCEGALNYIQDIITSANNVNIHVLRSGALLVFDKVGQVLEDELPIHIAWRTIMIELLKLLKNKQWGGRSSRHITKTAWKVLYRYARKLTDCYHIIYRMSWEWGKPLYLQVTGKSMKRNPMQIQNARPQALAKANNVEAIEWLAVTTPRKLRDHLEKLIQLWTNQTA